MRASDGLYRLPSRARMPHRSALPGAGSRRSTLVIDLEDAAKRRSCPFWLRISDAPLSSPRVGIGLGRRAGELASRRVRGAVAFRGGPLDTMYHSSRTATPVG